jgi:hypothetical protein
MEWNGAFVTSKEGDNLPPKNMPKWFNLLIQGLMWLLLTFILYWQWTDLDSEQFYLYFLYPFFSAYLVAGTWYQAWYLTTFRIAVGSSKFFFTVFVEVFLLILTIMAAENGYGGVKLFILFFIFSVFHVVLVVSINGYAKRKNV